MQGKMQAYKAAQCEIVIERNAWYRCIGIKKELWLQVYR